jgi:hypothetical protein
MYRPNLMTRTRSAGNGLRTLIVSAVGLLPVGVVSGMMLMQIFGVWTY